MIIEFQSNIHGQPLLTLSRSYFVLNFKRNLLEPTFSNVIGPDIYLPYLHHGCTEHFEWNGLSKITFPNRQYFSCEIMASTSFTSITTSCFSFSVNDNFPQMTLNHLPSHYPPQTPLVFTKKTNCLQQTLPLTFVSPNERLVLVCQCLIGTIILMNRGMGPWGPPCQFYLLLFYKKAIVSFSALSESHVMNFRFNISQQPTLLLNIIEIASGFAFRVVERTTLVWKSFYSLSTNEIYFFF